VSRSAADAPRSTPAAIARAFECRQPSPGETGDAALAAADFGRHQLFDVDQLGGIVARVAGVTVLTALVSYSLLQRIEREVAECVRAYKFANAFHCRVGGDQFVFDRRVHSIEAGRNRGRAGDPQMHFARARFTYHADYFLARGSTHDGVVHQCDTLPFQKITHGVKLQLHAEVTDRLRWFDECTPNVVIADQRVPKW